MRSQEEKSQPILAIGGAGAPRFANYSIVVIHNIHEKRHVAQLCDGNRQCS